MYKLIIGVVCCLFFMYFQYKSNFKEIHFNIFLRYVYFVQCTV